MLAAWVPPAGAAGAAAEAGLVVSLAAAPARRGAAPVPGPNDGGGARSWAAGSRRLRSAGLAPALSALAPPGRRPEPAHLAPGRSLTASSEIKQRRNPSGGTTACPAFLRSLPSGLCYTVLGVCPLVQGQ